MAQAKGATSKGAASKGAARTSGTGTVSVVLSKATAKDLLNALAQAVGAGSKKKTAKTAKTAKAAARPKSAARPKAASKAASK